MHEPTGNRGIVASDHAVVVFVFTSAVLVLVLVFFFFLLFFFSSGEEEKDKDDDDEEDVVISGTITASTRPSGVQRGANLATAVDIIITPWSSSWSWSDAWDAWDAWDSYPMVMDAAEQRWW